MNAEERREIFLSCFKCGRIVKSSDTECPRCGLQFGPGTLFECPFCCGLVWRNAGVCSTCGTDLTSFSQTAERTSSGFDMDEFVDNIINAELEDIKNSPRKAACPGCGLMLRGDEHKCPRCDLPLEEAQVDCPVCGEKISMSAKSCGNCFAVFEKEAERVAELAVAVAEAPAFVMEGAPSPGEPQAKKKAAKRPAAARKKPAKKGRAKKTKGDSST